MIFFIAVVSSCLFAQEKRDEPAIDFLTKRPPSVAEKKYDQILNNKYSFFSHKRSFFLPVSFNNKADESIYAGLPGFAERGGGYYKNVESEFQISFFLPVDRSFLKSDWDLMFAYTHHAWWQLYNGKWSKPFRETNYNPEFFFRRMHNANLLKGFEWITTDIGFMHQSNGQFQLLSRSWDRAFLRTHLKKNESSVILTLWYRLPESAEGDDNPAIQRYMGVGEVSFFQKLAKNNIELILPISERPGVTLRYSYPIEHNYMWFVSAQYGYGSSLIEHDHVVERLAVGVTVENFTDAITQR